MSNLEVKLKDGDNVLYPQAVGFGIDISNLLATYGDSKIKHTAKQDSFIVIINSHGADRTLTIDGASSFYIATMCSLVYFLKVGQSISANSNVTAKVYGIKR